MTMLTLPPLGVATNVGVDGIVAGAEDRTFGNVDIVVLIAVLFAETT